MDKNKTIPQLGKTTVSDSFLFPDKLRLQNEYLIKYGNEFLSLNNLKVGDIIDFEFPYEGIHQRFKSREMAKSTYKKTTKGILKKDDVGRLIVESVEDLPFYEYLSNAISGKRSCYKLVNRKSIVKLGTGFVF